MSFKKLMFLAGFVAGMTFLITSCKKDDSGSAFSTYTPAQCRLTESKEVHSSSNQLIYTFHYNSSNQVDSITATGSSTFQRRFTRSGNYIIRGLYGSVDTLLTRDSIVLNNSGMMTRFFANVKQDTTHYSSYFYDGLGQLAYSVAPSPFAASDTATYQWANGDYISRYANFLYDNSATYARDTLVQQGDFWYYSQMVNYGDPVLYKTAHLVRSITNPDGTTYFKYSLDPGGKIARIDVKKGNDAYFINFSYTCP